MITHSRLVAMLAMGGIALFALLIALAGPVHITISLAREVPAVSAACSADIPTVTPAPPTATSEPPTATSEPPTATPEPERTRKVPTPPAIAVPPTATVAPPVATPEPEPERTRKAPTPPAIAAPPTAIIEPSPQPAAPPTAIIEPSPQPAAPPANVVLTKAVDRALLIPGERAVYTLTASNTGGAPAHDVVVSDAVPDVFTVVDLFSSKGDIVLDGQTVRAYPAMLDPGETQTMRIVVEVRPAAAPGDVANSALITTSARPEDPGDNTATAVTTIGAPPAAPPAAPPITALEAPARLPVTADPDEPQGILAIYGPWLLVATMVLGLGGALRLGAFRKRLVTVALSSGARPAAPAWQPPMMAELAIDPRDLCRRWRAGATVSALTDELSARHPNANPLVIALAVRRLIDEEMGRS